MALNEIGYTGQPPVTGYGPGFFRVGNEVLRGALALMPDGARLWGGWDDHDFSGIDLLVVGCGADAMPLPIRFRETLEALDIGLEPMPTPAACRVYNLVLAEGRRVGLVALTV